MGNHKKDPCPECGNLKSIETKLCFKCSRIKLRKWHKEGFENYILYRRHKDRRMSYELREKVFAKLGSHCVKCGFSDKRALQVDHVYNDGYIDRKKNGWSDMKIRYRTILADTEGKYQILCANCNWIKKCEESEQRMREKYAII